MSVFQDLWSVKGRYLEDGDFWRHFLMYAQRDQGNPNTQCVQNFDSFSGRYKNLTASIQDDSQYLKGLAEKGKGSGTDFGFMLNKAEVYIDTIIDGVNLFNYCGLNHYFIALSKSFGSASGGVSQGINFIYRFFSHDDSERYYNMSVAMMRDDYGDRNLVGRYLGEFVSIFLMVDIPDTAIAPTYQPAGTMMD